MMNVNEKANSNKVTVIGVDLDDVLLDFNTTLCTYHNLQYGTTLTRDQISSYSLELAMNVTREEMMKRVLEFYETDHHFNGLPIPGSVESIGILSKKFPLYIVSAKPDYLKERSLIWIEQHYPTCFKEVLFTNQFAGDASRKKTKSEVCKELGINIFIDDSLKHAEDISKSGVKVYLLNAPWNQGDVPENVARMNDWNSICEDILTSNTEVVI
jgi:uncharacterized protein